MKALVLSGGGAHGSWQSGVVSALFDCGHKYDIVTGVSVGAINALGVAYGLGTSELRALWASLKSNSAVYKWAHWWSPLTAPWRTGLYSIAPLRAKLRDVVAHRGLVQTNCHIVCVDLASGMSEANLLTGDRNADVEAVLASASYPLAFEAVNGRTDGGIRDVTPLGLAIDLGATDALAVVCTEPKVEAVQAPTTLLGTATRMLDLILNEVAVNDLEVCRSINRSVTAGLDVKHKYVNLGVMFPSAPHGYGSLEFDGEKLAASFDRGYREV